MLKKSLIALAITSTAVTGFANAAAITATNINVALEGNHVSAATSVITEADVADITIDLGTALIVNDLVTITVSGSVWDQTDTPTIADATPANVGAALTFVDFSDANTARFRVSGADFTAADAPILTNFTFNTATAVDTTNVQVASTAISVNSLIGEYDAAPAVTIATFGNQLDNAYVLLNGEVSTGAGRAEFTTSALLDIFTATTTDNGGTDALTITSTVHTFGGDFSWLMDYDATANGGDADGVLEAAELLNAVTYTSNATGGQDTHAYAIDTGLTTLTATQTANAAIDTVNNFQFNNIGNTAGGSPITSPQSFTYSAVHSDGTNTIAIASTSAGAFTLDGSVSTMEFMPFGSEYAQSITVTNDGLIEGAITVDLISGGTVFTKTLTAVATARTVTNISLEVAAFAAESGIEGNAQVVVTVNAPGVVATGIYYHKADGDRIRMN